MLRVLLGVTDPELNILDTFEDVEYERRTVEVSLVVSGIKLILNALCLTSPILHQYHDKK